MLIKNRFYHFLIIIFLCLCALIYIGCATTAQPSMHTTSDDVADIDQLLGLDDQDDTIQEDDVLKLLGIVGDGSEDTESTLKAYEESGTNIETQSTGSSSVDWFNNPSKSPTSTSIIAARESTKQPLEDSKPITDAGSTSYQSRYENARQNYNIRQYKEAIQQFELLLEENSNHNLSDNCQYWVGESYYGTGNYQMAIVEFQKVFAFPKSNKLADSQLKIGLSYFKLNQKSRAQKELQKMIDNYPSSQYVSTAKRFISQINQEITP